ncbi:MAG: hypothetical protein IKR11_10390 [Solobacterium sp.]|nr:hypothetical protein [Solobacterium sp.]
MIYYVPGCDFNRNHPEEGRMIKEFILSGNVKLGQCCRKEIDYLKKGDTLITNCTLCDMMFAERCPDIQVISTYEYLLNEERFVWPDYEGEAITLQDCWRARNNPSIQEAVRKCLTNMNMHVVEMDENRNNSRYCGVWLNNPPAEDCVRLAPNTFYDLEKNYRKLLSAEEQKTKMEAWVSQYTTERTAVYCNGCEKGIRLGGGNPVHMIELLVNRK